MSTTTQILFNSPALHSLKRDQLVKLCKIHSIKASGKNVELIQKLKQHAHTLPKDSPLSIAVRGESGGPTTEEEHEEREEDANDDSSYRNQMPRQSEQWEMVMDSIQEEEENSSQGTLSSQRTLNNGGTGEFGTGSSKSTTVSSSIKALATSLGLKRVNSKATTTSKNRAVSPPPSNDELAMKSTPYSSLPPATSLPQTDHFTLDSARMSIDGTSEVPLPGHALRPGIQAPANARLSLGLGLGAPTTPTRQAQPTTTIRLVSNPLLNPGNSFALNYPSGENGTPQLKPFKTTFDISFGSPAPSGAGFGFGGTSTWPPRSEEDVQMKGIYPTLTFDDLPPSMPGSPATFSPKATGPFVFGSPHPKDNVSDNQFRSAAAAVLEEMNQRLREDGVDEIGLDIISKLHPDAKKEQPREIKPIPASKRGEITGRFQKLHDQEFQKMQGIDDLVKKRAERSPPKKETEKVVVGRKRKSSVIERDGGAGPRRPSAIAGRASATRVISNGRRAKVLPGAFGLDDDDDDEEREEEERAGKRVRMDPEAGPSTVTPEEERQQADEERRRVELDNEKEAIRKKLEANRARRRSSAAHAAGGRKSIGRPRPSVLTKPKPKPSRFGFLSSAKTLVQNVWNRGKAPAADAAPSNIPKPSTVVKPEPTKEKMGPPSLVPAKKSSVAAARPTTAVASGSRAPAIRINNAEHKAEEVNGSGATKGSIASSSRSRSPLPSFNTSSSRNSLLSNGGTRTSRTSSVTGPASHTSSFFGTGASKSRSSSSSNISSIGTRMSSTRVSPAGLVNSMGSKKIMSGSSIASRTSTTGTASSSRLATSSSRLLAPTASSLAKMHRSSTAASSGLKPLSEDRQHSQAALGTITNSLPVTSPKSPAGTPGAFSPKPGRIFSKPLTLPQQSGIPTPVKRRNLSGESSTSAGEDGSQAQDQSKPNQGAGPTRVRSLNGRKPRISRSKVIARLASQRAATGGRVASGSSIASGLAPRASGAGKTRSSLGAKVSRASFGGGARSRPSAGGAANGLMMSAKKRARQSEYARRRSRVGPLNFDGPTDVSASGSAMEVDASQ
ncbi:hypothetical protein BDZ97DRAFT_1814361 [Flammula alnicola]|nr:hypothetical protein BDZ97DRAFT_1814361 [Flammula alnicola]